MTKEIEEFLNGLRDDHKKFETVNRLSIKFGLRFHQALEIYESWKEFNSFLEM